MFKYLSTVYHLFRDHPPYLLNPYLNLSALNPINVKAISKNYNPTGTYAGFTVVIVIRNEVDSILALLKSIEAQTIMPSQIVVIDGGSTDDTIKIIKKYQKNSRLNLAVYELPGSTISEGANFGIVNASTELIVTLHAGCVLDSHCFANLVGPITSARSIDLVAGLYHSKHRDSENYLIPDWQAIDWGNFIPSSRICCFKKSIALQAGLFASDLIVGEDTYFFVKYRALSRKWIINQNAFLYWDNPNTLETHDRVLYKYAVGDGISGFGDYLYYSHYRLFEGKDEHQKNVYLKGYKDGKKQRYGHLFYKEKIRGILIIFSDLMMYQNLTNSKLLSLINQYIADKWHVIYLAPTLQQNFSIVQPTVYLPLDLTKVNLLPLETFFPFVIKSYLTNIPLPVKIINQYSGSLWRYKVLLTNLLYPVIIKQP